MEYTPIVMDHFTNPRNMGELKDANGIGEVGNIRCGDVMKMYVKIENDIIRDVKFKTFGCVAAVASSSMATTMIKGKSVSDALKIRNQHVLKKLGGLPPIKVHCSVLAEEAIKLALKDYYDKKGISYDKKQFPDCANCAHCSHH